MDFSDIINKHLETYVAEKLPLAMDKHIEKMIDSILGDLFSQWGENSKQVKETISKKINLDLTKLSLIDYNGMIATAIQNHFNDIVLTQSVDPIMKLMGEIVGEKYPKDIITIDDLFEDIKEIVIGAGEHGDTGEVSFFAKYNPKFDWIDCYADIEPDQTQDRCGIRFTFRGVKATKEQGGGTIFIFTLPGYNGKESTIDVTRFDKVEKLIHKLWTSGVKISVPDYLEEGEMEFDRDFEVDLSDS